MIGLIRKDLYNLLSGWKILAVSIVIMVTFATVKEMGAIVICLLPTFFGLGVIGCVQQDAQKKWYDYHKILPISLRSIVTSRYLSYLCFTCIGLLVTVIYGYGIQFTMGIETLGTRFAMWQGLLLGITIALSFAAVFLPTTYYNKGEKMEISMMLSGFVAFGSVSLVLKLLKLMGIDLMEYTDMFIQILFMASLIAFILSWIVAVIIYQKRSN